MWNERQRQLAGRIMVALDYPTATAAERLLEQLHGTECYVKVGLELFYAAGPEFVRGLKQRGYKVFLDVKMHDIPNTVRGGAASVTRLGVDMFNIHAAGGQAMMEAALRGVEEASTERLLSSDAACARPIVIAVTQLTSTSQQVMNEQIGVAGTVEASVLHYSRLANQAGIQGVVASPHEVSRIKAEVGESFITVTPGIRPAGSEIGDQTRIMTPAAAFAQGSDFIVIGRPITAAADPRQAFIDIVTSCSD
jgi:orotidine-5'-phosphate decarboxylase